MVTDHRYKTAQKLIRAGMMNSLAELFETLDKTPLAKDMHTAPSRLTKLINNPLLFTFEDCKKIAALLEVEYDQIIDIIRTATRSDGERRSSSN